MSVRVRSGLVPRDPPSLVPLTTIDTPREEPTDEFPVTVPGPDGVREEG